MYIIRYLMREPGVYWNYTGELNLNGGWSSFTENALKYSTKEEAEKARLEILERYRKNKKHLSQKKLKKLIKVFRD